MRPGLLLTTQHPPPPGPPPPSDWAKFFSGPLANLKFSLAPLAPVNFGHKFSSGPLKLSTTGGGGTPTTGLRERGNDTSKSTGRSSRQKAATRRNMRREERVTVQGPVKEQQPDGMSHRGIPPPPFKRSPGEGDSRQTHLSIDFLT